MIFSRSLYDLIMFNGNCGIFSNIRCLKKSPTHIYWPFKILVLETKISDVFGILNKCYCVTGFFQVIPESSKTMTQNRYKNRLRTPLQVSRSRSMNNSKPFGYGTWILYCYKRLRASSTCCYYWTTIHQLWMDIDNQLSIISDAGIFSPQVGQQH